MLKFLFGNDRDKGSLGNIYAEMAKEENQKQVFKQEQAFKAQLEKDKILRNADQVIQVVEKNPDGTVIEKTTYIYNKC